MKISDTIAAFEVASFFRVNRDMMSTKDRQATLDVINGVRVSAYVEVGTEVFFLTNRPNETNERRA